MWSRVYLIPQQGSSDGFATVCRPRENSVTGIVFSGQLRADHHFSFIGLSSTSKLQADTGC